MIAEGQPVVLVVDDEPSVRLFLRKAVERCGYSALVAGGAVEARALIDAERFDCAMVDKNLPDGSGLELLDLIRQRQPDADVVIVTGYVNSQSAIEALRLGAVDYICKPFDFDAVEHRLKAVIERRRSMSEMAQLQAMLAHADRLSSLGSMAAGVVHEINNPLSFVGCNLSFLDEELTELQALVSPEVAARLAACVQASRECSDGVKRVVSIVKDLRMFSRKDGEEQELVQASSCLESALKVATPAVKGLKVDRRLDASLPHVRISSTRLEQVLLNLIVNAAQAIASTGRLDGVLLITTSKTQAGEVVIELADNGAGMSPETQQRLFEPFFTTKPKDIGTGLGLSVCQGIVVGAGGRIEVRSELGVGTVFKLIFPGVPAEAAPRQVA